MPRHSTRDSHRTRIVLLNPYTSAFRKPWIGEKSASKRLSLQDAMITVLLHARRNRGEREEDQRNQEELRTRKAAAA